METKIIRVSRSLYSKEVLLKTAYSMTDRAFIHLEQDGKDWIVSWKPRNAQQINEGEFENELIAQSLREKLLEQSTDLRKLILARAFASTVMDNRQGDLPETSPEEENALPGYSEHITEKEKSEILRGWFEGQ